MAPNNEVFSCIFWNVGRKIAPDQAKPRIQALQKATGAQLMVFAEPQNLPAESPLGPEWTWATDSSRVRLLFHNQVNIEAVQIRKNFVIWQLRAPLDLLLMTVHLPSLLHRVQDDIRFAAREAANDLRTIEDREKHRRSIVVGDFNLDPFDVGLVQADSFHGVSCRKLASQGHRTLGERPYPLFYNPSWNWLGDEPAPPGTYCYTNESTVPYRWHVFDQVLVRPELIDPFDFSRFGVVTTTPEQTFEQNGHPFPSDHFPVRFGLRLAPG